MTRAELEALLPPVGRGGNTRRRRLDGIEDYLFIGGDRMSARQAAERLGVTERSIVRYRAVLRQAGAR